MTVLDGLQAATGGYIAFMDGDGQFDIEDLGRLVALMPAADLATGYGRTSYQGSQLNNSGTYRRDYNGNNSGAASQANGNRAAQKYGADVNYAFSSQSTEVYNSPIVDNCSKNFVIIASRQNIFRLPKTARN